MVIYPAIFIKDGEGYYVKFPDLKGCLTEGETLEQALVMAQEALGGYLASMKDRGLEIPLASEVASITSEEGFVSIVACDISKYSNGNKAVKKTLTIPQWLNDAAERQNLNFSKILQEAISSHLNI